MGATALCPICSRRVKPKADNPSFPFCTPTCNLVDLGRWLSGSYRVNDDSLESDGSPADEHDLRRPTEDE